MFNYGYHMVEVFFQKLWLGTSFNQLFVTYVLMTKPKAAPQKSDKFMAILDLWNLVMDNCKKSFFAHSYVTDERLHILVVAYCYHICSVSIFTCPISQQYLVIIHAKVGQHTACRQFQVFNDNVAIGHSRSQSPTTCLLRQITLTVVR